MSEGIPSSLMIGLLNHCIPILCLTLVRTPRKNIINYNKNFYRNYLVIILLDFYIKVDNDQKKTESRKTK